MNCDYYLGALLQESRLCRFGFAAGCEAWLSRAGRSPCFPFGLRPGFQSVTSRELGTAQNEFSEVRRGKPHLTSGGKAVLVLAQNRSRQQVVFA
jgi:hypothetical protein